MSFLKEHNGVKIYVSNTGEFYCNPTKNDGSFNDKMFHSQKLQSIEKAIDEFKGGEVIDGNEYYEIDAIYNICKKLKIVRKVGNRLFFDDGSDSTAWEYKHKRKDLFPASFEQTEEFKSIKANFEKINEIREKKKELDRIETQLMDENYSILKKSNHMKVEPKQDS